MIDDPKCRQRSHRLSHRQLRGSRRSPTSRAFGPARQRSPAVHHDGMNAPARSKLFTAALENLMQERGVNQVELARRTGIAISRINNYLRGHYRTIKPGHVGAIAEALGGGAAGAILVEAYLFDLLPDSCRGLIEVRYLGMKHGERWAVPNKGLSRAFAGQFKDLYRLCASDAKVRTRTAEWIQLMQETKD